jgi:hypothetical protein
MAHGAHHGGHSACFDVGGLRRLPGPQRFAGSPVDQLGYESRFHPNAAAIVDLVEPCEPAAQDTFLFLLPSYGTTAENSRAERRASIIAVVIAASGSAAHQ